MGRTVTMGVLLAAGACATACLTRPLAPRALSATRQSAPSLDLRRLSGTDGDQLQRAVSLIDTGALAASIEILQELRSRNRDNAYVVHELALALRLNRQPQRAVEILRPYRRGLTAEIAAGFGSALDDAGDRRGAIEVLSEAIQRYPRSGLLRSELGTTLAGAGRGQEALAQYQTGMQIEPRWPSNYMQAARLLSESDASGLSLIYGEIFRVLEPNSQRSAQMAELLVKICRNAVTVTGTQGSRREARVKLAPPMVIYATPSTPPEQVLEFPLANTFELAFGGPLTVAVEHGLSLESLHQARLGFLEIWFNVPTAARTHPVRLFEWQKALRDAGHFEAYDYWLLGPAFPAEFQRWADAHSSEMSAMITFVRGHPLY